MKVKLEKKLAATVYDCPALMGIWNNCSGNGEVLFYLHCLAVKGFNSGEDFNSEDKSVLLLLLLLFFKTF